MLRWGRIEVSGGFLLLTAFLCYLGEEQLLLWTLSACALHELGHYIVVRLLGGRLVRLRLTCVGAEMQLAGYWNFAGWWELISALAGPAANFLVALLVLVTVPEPGETGFLFVGLNLALGIFNLLPAETLDGGRALRCLFAWIGPEWLGVRLTRWMQAGLGTVLIAWAGYTAVQHCPNITLLALGGWFLLPMFSKSAPLRKKRYDLKKILANQKRIW